MRDTYMIFYEMKHNGTLQMINHKRWATFPEADPVLGVARSGWSLGESATSQFWRLRCDLRAEVSETILFSTAGKSGYGMGTSNPIRVSDWEWRYLVKQLVLAADKEDEGAYDAHLGCGSCFVNVRDTVPSPSSVALSHRR